ncbi:hypothetical protein MMPV_007177 [Pyropia vietnamensis]
MASSRVAYPSSPTVNAALNWSLAALRVAPSPTTRVLHNPTAAALIAAAPPAAVTRPAAGSTVRVFAAPSGAAATPTTPAAASAQPSAVQWVRLLSAVAGRLERSSTLYVVDGDVGGTAGVRLLTASPAVAAAAQLALGRLPRVLLRSALTPATLLVGAAPSSSASSATGMGHHVLSATALTRAWACAPAEDGAAAVTGDVLTTPSTRLTRDSGVRRSVGVPPTLTLVVGDGRPAKAGAKAPAATAVSSEAAAAFYFLAARASPAAAAVDRVAAAWAFGRAAAAAGADVLVSAGGGKAAKAELADRVAAEVAGTGVSVKGDELVDDVPDAPAS